MKKTNLRKLAAFTASILAVAAMAAPMTAFAATVADGVTGNSITITATDEATHEYEAYQIFTGTLEEGVLTNINWGDGVDSVALLSALKSDDTIGSYFTSAATAADVATALNVEIGEEGNKTKVFADDNEKMQIFASIVGKHLTATTSGTVNGTTISKLPDGYYIVQDSKAPTNTEDDRDNTGAMTRYIVKVAGANVPVTAKHSAPTVMKKVLEKGYNSGATGDTVKFGNDTDTDTAGVQNDYILEKDYNDVADYSIGDTVSFTLYGSLPSTFEDYKAYYYKFNDTLGKEFDIDETTIKVFVNGVEVADNKYNIHKDVTVGADNTKIEITIEDVNALASGITANSIITVKYDAVLNEQAVIGLNGQENEVYLEYSNNPNIEYTPKTDGPGSGDEDKPNGDTPESEVAGEYDENDTTPEKPSETTDDNGTPDDTTDDETNDNIGETPVDKVIVFTYEQNFTKKDATTGEVLTDAEFVLSRTNNSTTEYLKVLDEATAGVYIVDSWVTDKAQATTLKAASDGTYKISGLEDGSYILEETKKPAGYNDPSDPTTELTITATTVNNQTWKGVASDALTGISLTAANDVTNTAIVDAIPATDTSKGKVYATITNTQGTTLPSTGGMGTTLFYVGGGALALGAGVLLVSKKRMANK